MSSGHTKPAKNVGFFNTLGVVSDHAWITEWRAPKLSWTAEELDKYDAVFFGLSPVTSPSANYSFAALSFLNKIYDSPKLRIIIDTPQLWQYKNSIKAASANPAKHVFNSFFSRRYDYAKALADESTIKNITEVLEKLSTGVWPRAIVPSLPWTDLSHIAEYLNLSTVIDGINLDSFLIENLPTEISRNQYWAVDGLKNQWSVRAKKTLMLDTRDVKSGRSFDDVLAAETIETAIGLISAPQDRKVGPWWSYRISQAISLGTPIITDWTYSGSFDSSWGYLGYQVEDMDPVSRYSLAGDQKLSYLSAIPNQVQVVAKLKDLLESK